MPYHFFLIKKAILSGTSALVCLALSIPVMANDFVITSSDNSTNGVGTTNGATAAAIAAAAIDGSDTVSLGIALTTTGTNVGIKSTNDDNTITVSETGSITTGLGNSAYGIYNYGNSNVTTVSGSITTEGAYAHGILVDGNSNVTTVSGSITTVGENAEGIRSTGNTNAVTVSGSVSSTGSSALLNHSGSGNSFTLDEGAVIIGDITTNAFTSNSKLTFNLGQGASYAYSIGGGLTIIDQFTFNDADERDSVATHGGTNCINSAFICNLVTAVGNGNAEAQDELQFSMNSFMIGSLEFSSNQANDSIEAMAYAQKSKSNTWANVYGGTSKRASSTTQSSFNTSNAGLTIGTPVPINDTLDVDLVFNTSRASLDIGLTKDQEITANSYNFGAVVNDLAPATGWAVDVFGFIGRNSYDGKRKVMNNNIATGSETVTAAYSGNEILLGLDAQYSQAINNTFNFTGGINANLSNEKIEAYSESKYYSWDARTMLQAAGGINLGLEHNKDALTTFASLGLQHSSLQKGKTATYTNNGTTGSFIDKATSDTRRSATVGFSYKASDNIAFKGAVEAFTSENGVDGNSANLRINWAF